MAAPETAPRRRRRAAAEDTPAPRATPNARVSSAALLASGIKLEPGNRAQSARFKKAAQEWQRYAWDYFDALPPIHYAHDYYGNVCSRVRLYAGFQGDPDEPPIPLDDLTAGDPDAELPEGLDATLAQAAVDAMQRLDDGADGGLPAVAGDFAVNLALTGEAFLVGKNDPDSATGERFQVYSTEQCQAKGDGWRILEKGDSTGEPVTDADFLARVWRKHRRWRELADAPMRALLDDCDNLLLLKRVLRAVSSSRIHGGILRVPAELEFPQRATDPTEGGQSTDSPFMEQLAIALTTPIQDPASVNSVVPLEVKGPAALLKELTWLDLGRGYGQNILAEIAELTKNIAVGLDLPVEVVTGMGDSNHWSAWQISEETFKAHIEPLMQTIVRGLTDAYLWPLLRAQGLDPSKVQVWYDPTALVGHDNLFDNMARMHEKFAVSDAALRRAGGATEDDEPDDDEIQRRLYIAQQLRVTIREQGEAPAGELQPDTLEGDTGSPQAPPGQTTPPAKAAPPAPPATPKAAPAGDGKVPAALDEALTAAARPQPELGRRLMEIDRDLRLRIQTMADHTLQRILDVAGSRVRGKLSKEAQRPSTRPGKIAAQLREETAAMPLGDVARFVGRSVVESYGLSEEELIDERCVDLEGDWNRQVRRSTVAALLAARAHAGGPDLLPEDRIDEVADAGADAAKAGFAILAGAIVAAAHERLFSEGPTPPRMGELDREAAIPLGVVRDALAVAGGQTAAQAEVAPAGVAVGPLVLGALKESLSIAPTGWQWVYGYPDREFEPHYELEGVEFSSWQDDLLANPDAWPPVDYFHPGDHAGCACSYIPMFEGDRPADDEAPLEEG